MKIKNHINLFKILPKLFKKIIFFDYLIYIYCPSHCFVMTFLCYCDLPDRYPYHHGLRSSASAIKDSAVDY